MIPVGPASSTLTSASGKLKPVIDKVFPLQEARAAHEHLERSEMFGKVVLTV